MAVNEHVARFQILVDELEGFVKVLGDVLFLGVPDLDALSFRDKFLDLVAGYGYDTFHREHSPNIEGDDAWFFDVPRSEADLVAKKVVSVIFLHPVFKNLVTRG